MKRFSRLAVIITLISISILGCGNKIDQAENNQQPDNQLQSNYFVSDQKAEINSTDDQITWKTDEVTLIAKKSPATITSMQISNDTNEYDIRIPEEITGNSAELTSIALNSNNDLIAVNVFITNVGNQVIIIDLSNGESDTLNELAGISYETIHAFGWSPIDNKLAFAYGDTSSSKLAIYDFNQHQLQNVSEINLINTLFILWTKQGDGFDFISEANSDQFKLYRYKMGNDEVEEIAEISREELSKFNEYGPDRF